MEYQATVKIKTSEFEHQATFQNYMQMCEIALIYIGTDITNAAVVPMGKAWVLYEDGFSQGDQINVPSLTIGAPEEDRTKILAWNSAEDFEALREYVRTKTRRPPKLTIV